jgi:hypothetical protein
MALSRGWQGIFLHVSKIEGDKTVQVGDVFSFEYRGPRWKVARSQLHESHGINNKIAVFCLTTGCNYFFRIFLKVFGIFWNSDSSILAQAACGNPRLVRISTAAALSTAFFRRESLASPSALKCAMVCGP